MNNGKYFQWSRIVETMRFWANQEKSPNFVGVSTITGQEQAWKLKKLAMFAILSVLSNLIKEDQHDNFYCTYWTLKAYGMICMDFKDLEEARKVFTRLKNECEDHHMYKHKMVTYKQLGYVHRLLKMHAKAASCFKKFLQLAWYNEDMAAEMQAYQNLAIDNYYQGQIEKAAFYDEKFKLGDYEGPEAVVRKVAVGIVKNRIESK